MLAMGDNAGNTAFRSTDYSNSSETLKIIEKRLITNNYFAMFIILGIKHDLFVGLFSLERLMMTNYQYRPIESAVTSSEYPYVNKTLCRSNPPYVDTTC